MKLHNIAIALLIGVMLSACSDTDEKDTELTDGSQNDAIGINDASTSGLNGGADINGTEMGGGRMGRAGRGGAGGLGPSNDPSSPLSKRTIYFMLDSSQVLDDFVPILAAHAQYLVANPSQRVVLEGHADERGSREYNIALGEQRAKSVANILKSQGVGEEQINIVSYGEEKPAAFGSDEASWELNRRVELAY